MVTKIKTTVFAAKLRKRLAELKKKREADVKAHKAAIAKWRADLTVWLKANGEKRIVSLTPHPNNRRYSEPHFNVGSFFDGAPNPPESPDDSMIRKISGMLRHLGITGQATVQVSTQEVAELFGEVEP